MDLRPIALANLPHPEWNSFHIPASVQSCCWQLLSWQHRETHSWHCYENSCCSSGGGDKCPRRWSGQRINYSETSPRVSKIEATVYWLNENTVQLLLQRAGNQEPASAPASLLSTHSHAWSPFPISKNVTPASVHTHHTTELPHLPNESSSSRLLQQSILCIVAIVTFL